MPARTVTVQHGMRARRDLGADFLQMLVHRLDIGRRHKHGGADCPGWAYGPKDVGGTMAVIAHYQRARADRAPPTISGQAMPWDTWISTSAWVRLVRTCSIAAASTLGKSLATFTLAVHARLAAATWVKSGVGSSDTSGIWFIRAAYPSG